MNYSKRVTIPSDPPAMMLRYSLDLPEQAARIEKAIGTVLRKGVRTGDICQEGCQRVGTREMGEAVLRAL